MAVAEGRAPVEGRVEAECKPAAERRPDPGELLATLRATGQYLAVAESLTGGQLCSSLVECAGASDVFLGGVVAYNSLVKHDLLGVDAGLIGAGEVVSAEMARQLARGVALRLAAACGLPVASVIGVGVTGVAGPGLQEGKPAGLVFAAAARVGEGGNWQFAERAMRPSAELPVTGDRSEVRLLAVELGLSTVFDISAHR